MHGLESWNFVEKQISIKNEKEHDETTMFNKTQIRRNESVNLKFAIVS